MNSQNSSDRSLGNAYPNINPLARFSFPPNYSEFNNNFPLDNMFQPQLQPQLQMMIKWRNQMARVLRSQPVSYYRDPIPYMNA